MLFLVTEKLPTSDPVRMHDDVTAYIMRRSEQGGGGQAASREQTEFKIHRNML